MRAYVHSMSLCRHASQSARRQYHYHRRHHCLISYSVFCVVDRWLAGDDSNCCVARCCCCCSYCYRPSRCRRRLRRAASRFKLQAHSLQNCAKGLGDCSAREFCDSRSGGCGICSLKHGLESSCSLHLQNSLDTLSTHRKTRSYASQNGFNVWMLRMICSFEWRRESDGGK